MRPYRPSSVLVVAILQLCFGGLALCLNVCGGATQLAGGSAAFMPAGSPQVAQQKQFEQDIKDLMEQKVPHLMAWQYFGLALSVASAALMVASGMGLLKMRPWARWLTVIYAVLYIVRTVAGVAIAVTITLPITTAIMEELSARGNVPPAAAPMLNAMGPWMQAATYGQLVLLAYPIMLLTIMFLPGVRAAFRAVERKPVAEVTDEGWEDESPRDEGIRPGDR